MVLGAQIKERSCVDFPSIIWWLPSCWSFRLQVNSESVSERSGLAPGDLILAVNGESVAEKTHKSAQDVIVRAGNRWERSIFNWSRFLKSGSKIGPNICHPDVGSFGHLVSLGWSPRVRLKPMIRNPIKIEILFGMVFQIQYLKFKENSTSPPINLPWF